MYRTIRALLKKSDCSFAPSGPTIGEIEALAAGIRDHLNERGAPADEPVCLCVEERSHLLAALLASIAGAPPFILPHAFQPQVLEEVQVARPFPADPGGYRRRAARGGGCRSESRSAVRPIVN